MPRPLPLTLLAVGLASAVLGCPDEPPPASPASPTPSAMPAPPVPPAKIVSPYAYPGTRREDVRDVLHGVTVEDPYRWLEDGKSPR